MDLVIREARPDDAPVLVEAERVLARTPGRLASRPEELLEEDFRAKIVKLSQAENGIYVVAERAGVVVGHALLDPLKLAVTAHVVVLTIAVHEGHQRTGVGRALMEHLIGWARRNPAVEKIELQVRSGNEPAIRLYQQLGFQEEGRKLRRLKYGPGRYLDDIYMGLWVGD